MLNLLWKEWREQRWKMAFGTVMLVFFTTAFLTTQIINSREGVLIINGLGGILLALYSAMGVFAPEDTQRTTLFLLAKPAPAWQVFLSKWLMGALNIWVPLAISCMIIWFSVQDEPIPHFLTSVVYLTCFCTIIYTATCCLAPRRCGEAAVGLVGLGLMLISIFHFTGLDSLVRNGKIRGPLIAFNPLCWLALLDQLRWPSDQRDGAFIIILVQVILWLAVMAYGLRQWKRRI